MSTKIILAWLLIVVICVFGCCTLQVERKVADRLELSDLGSTDCPGGVCVKPCKCESCKCKISP